MTLKNRSPRPFVGPARRPLPSEITSDGSLNEPASQACASMRFGKTDTPVRANGPAFNIAMPRPILTSTEGRGALWPRPSCSPARVASAYQSRHSN